MKPSGTKYKIDDMVWIRMFENQAIKKYKNLELLETDKAGKSVLPIAVIKSFRQKLQVIRAAPDERTLREWKSLHFEKLSGDRKGQYSIKLNDQWRMVFHLNKDCLPPKISILEIVDYH